MKSRSFALILALLIMAFLSYLSVSVVQKFSFLLDLGIERDRFYKNFYLAERIFEVELNLIKKSFDVILEKVSLRQKPIFLNCSALLKTLEAQKLQALLVLCKGKEAKGIYVALELKEKERVICKLSCLFSKRKAKGKNVGTLSLTQSASKQYSNEFIIDHFTINDSI